jgi:hypothetical protein
MYQVLLLSKENSVVVWLNTKQEVALLKDSKESQD